MAHPTRDDTWRVTAAIDGEDSGVWDKKTGGSGDSEESKYRPGGMGPQIVLGGAPSTENVTASRLFDIERDGAKAKQWFARRGKARATVVQQPLDLDGNAFGDPFVYQAIVKQVTIPDHDSMGNDPAMLEIEFSTAEMA